MPRRSLFQGGHTGAIQSLGGGGDISNGGSGSGGRIAIYHNTAMTVMPYQGNFDTQGGRIGRTAEPGASGTAYIKHRSSGHSTVRVDNRNRMIKVMMSLMAKVRLDIWRHIHAPLLTIIYFVYFIASVLN